MCTHTHTHTCIVTYNIYAKSCTQTFTHMQVHAHSHACTHACTHTSALHARMCTHTHTHTHTHTRSFYSVSTHSLWPCDLCHSLVNRTMFMRWPVICVALLQWLFMVDRFMTFGCWSRLLVHCKQKLRQQTTVRYNVAIVWLLELDCIGTSAEWGRENKSWYTVCVLKTTGSVDQCGYMRVQLCGIHISRCVILDEVT